MATFHGIWTFLLLVIFVAIAAWAWSGKRKKSFDEAARLPLDDEIEHKESTAEKHDG